MGNDAVRTRQQTAVADWEEELLGVVAAYENQPFEHRDAESHFNVRSDLRRKIVERIIAIESETAEDEDEINYLRVFRPLLKRIYCMQRDAHESSSMLQDELRKLAEDQGIAVKDAPRFDDSHFQALIKRNASLMVLDQLIHLNGLQASYFSIMLAEITSSWKLTPPQAEAMLASLVRLGKGVPTHLGNITNQLVDLNSKADKSHED